jgi:DNA-binding MarR family transcriptional regulator
MESQDGSVGSSSTDKDDTERVRERRRLIVLLAAVSDAVRRDTEGIAPEFAAKGNWGDLELLGRIYFEHGGEARPSQLTGFTYTTSAGVTGSLRRLEDEGLITRERTEEDRRVLLACITDAGRAAIEAAVPAFDLFVDKRLGDLSDDEVDWLFAFILRQLEM